MSFDELVMAAVEYWTTVSNFMLDWLKIKNRELRPIELRHENISTHSVVLRALGGVGAEITKRYPTEWKDRLSGLKEINWSKRNRDWENVCMVANSVVANRQARVATKAYLKRKLGLPVSDAEERSIEHLTARIEPNHLDVSLPSYIANNHRRQTIHPVEVRIGTAVVRVNRFNQIPVVVANWILRQNRSLVEIPNFVQKTRVGFFRTAQTKELENGWFIEIGDSQEILIQKGRRLLDGCGFRDVQLQVILDDGNIRAA